MKKLKRIVKNKISTNQQFVDIRMVRKLVLISVLLILALCSVQHEKKRFDHYSVITIRFENEEKLNSFRMLFQNDSLDVWSYDGRLGVNVDLDIMFSPEQQKKLFMFATDSKGLSKFEVKIKNVQKLIDQEEREMKSGNKVSTEEYFRMYHDFENIVAFLQVL